MVCKWHNHIIVICLFIGLSVYSWTANYLLVISRIGYPTMHRFYECPKIHCVWREKGGIFGTNSKLLGLFFSKVVIFFIFFSNWFLRYFLKSYFLPFKTLTFSFFKSSLPFLASFLIPYPFPPYMAHFGLVLFPLTKAAEGNFANCSICTCISISCSNFILKKN